jgi:hypothetical protein
MNEYKDLKLHSNILLVAPFSVSIICKEQAKDDFSSENVEVIYDSLFEQTFPIGLKIRLHIDSVQFARTPLQVPLNKRTIILDDKNTIDINIPYDSTIVKYDTSKADYVLFINKYSIEYTSPIIRKDSYTPGGILHKSDFVIWDNIKGKIVTVGHVESKAYYDILVKAITVWKRGIETFGKDIIYSSPFK